MASLVKPKIVSVHRNLICIICSYVLTSPYQSVCGCRACYQCWREYIGENECSECPGKSEDCGLVSFIVSSYLLRPDNGAKREANNILVYCVNKNGNEGCQIKMQYKLLNQHLNEECQYNQEICKQCNKKILKMCFNNHRSECEMEFETCKFCDGQFTRRELREHHHNLTSSECCKSYKGVCPFCNYYPMDAIKIHAHKTNCDSWIYPCSFQSLGCDFSGTKSQINEHECETRVHHTQLLGQCLSANDSVISHSKFLSNNIKLQIQNLDAKMSTTKERFSQTEVLIKNFKTIPRTIDVNPGNSNIIHRSGIFVWKVTEVMEKLLTARTSTIPYIISDPFYTSSFGYKVCAKLYLNGDGQATGKYISFFICIMKGEYDEILIWPFRNKVTLSLLDQGGSSNHYSHTFRPDVNSMCFQKPVRELNTASGVPCFYDLTSLNNSRYFNKDTIYLKVLIHSVN